MQNEMDSFYHYNKFEYNHDFEKLTMHYWYTKFYMKKITINFCFSETLTYTCEQKIKSFTIEQKQSNQLILYQWSIVQLVIYDINERSNITMN